MKRLNVRLLIILVVTVVVLTAGVVGVHAFQTSRNVDNLLRLAEEAEKGGDLRLAMTYYERYFRHNPENLDHLAKHALLSLKYAETLDGRRYLKYAHDAMDDYVRKAQASSDTSHPEVREKLVDLQMRIGNFVSAKDHLMKLKAANKAANKEDPLVDLRLAKCLIYTAYYVEAVQLLEPLVGYDRATKTFDAAKAKAPKEIEAYALLALLLQDRITDVQMPNRRAVADQTMEQLVKVNPDNAKAVLAHAQYVMQRSLVDAKPLVEHALSLAPNDVDAILLAVGLAVNEKNYAKAEELLAHGVKENSKDSRLYYARAKVAMDQNHLEESEKIVRDGLDKLPNDPGLLELRFQLQIVRKDYQGADGTLKLLESAQMPAALRELLHCRLLLQRGEFTQAAKRIEAVRPKLVGNEQRVRQTDLMLLEAYQNMGAWDKVKDVAVRLGEFLNAQLSEAQALLSQGKTVEALDRFEAIARGMGSERLVKTPAVWRPLYELRVGQQLNKPKESKNWQKVESLVALLREQGALPEPSISLLDVDLLIRKDANDQARAKLDELVKNYPDNAAVLSALARFSIQRGDAAAAAGILEKASAGMQNDPLVVSTRIETIVAGKASREEKIRQLSQIGESAASMPEDSQLQAYTSLGVAFIQQGDTAGAMRWWKKAAEIRPDHVRLQWMMFDLARSAPDQTAMKEIGKWFSTKLGVDSEQAKLIEAVQIVTAVREAQKGKIAPTQNEVVLDASERESLKKARSLLNDIKNQRPGWHEHPRLLAEINILEGQFDEAIANLEEALQLGPANGLMIRQLVQLLYVRNQFEKAKNVLVTYSSYVGSDLDKLKIAVDAQVGGDTKLTEEQIDKAVDEDTTNVSDLLFRANLLASSGKTDEAESAYRKAITLGSDSPEVWLALVGHLAKNKKGAEAHKVVQEAQIQLPEDRRALTLAQGYEVLNDVGQADQFYLTALEAGPNDPGLLRAVAAYYLRTNRVAQARTYLDKILRNPPPVNEQNENYSWARREVAKLLAAEPDYQQFVKAMDMLKPLNKGLPDPQDLTLKAGLLSQRGEPASAREALQLLKTLQQQRPLHTVERLLQAQLLERLGNWTAAKSEMVTLVTQPKPLPAAYVAYIEMLLRNGGVSEANSWLGALKEAAPDAPEIMLLSARLDAAQGRGAQAAANLKKELPSQKPLPKEQWPRLRAMAGIMEQIKQYDEAEKMLREYVSYVPQDALLLPAFLGGRGKVDEAIGMVEQLRRNFSASPVLQVLLISLRQKVAPPTKEQMERAEAVFNLALRDDPESSLVQIQLAGLREVQGEIEKSEKRLAEAEKLYRDIYARSETRPGDRAIVANNLAYILAIQGKQFDEALKLVNQSMAYLGPQSDILDTRGLIYVAQGNAQKAIADLSEAVVGPSPMPAKLVHLAIAQAAAKDEAGARESLRKAKELNFDPIELPPGERAMYDAMLRQLGQQAFNSLPQMHRQVHPALLTYATSIG